MAPETPVAVVVYESMFGSSRAVAEAVARGLREAGLEVHVRDVGEPSTAVGPRPPSAPDLLVVGGPTHAFSMSRPATRADAVRQGADPVTATTGLREWLETTSLDSAVPVAVFDTRVSTVRRLPAAAGPAAARVLRRRGHRVLGRPEGFVVADTRGGLLPGELDRARAWGRTLAELTAPVGGR